jgi:hypothetical protein
MNQLNLSTLGFSSRKRPATHRTLEAAHRRQTRPADRPRPHFLLDTNERNQNTSIAVTHSKQTTAPFSTRYKWISTRYKVTVIIYRAFPHPNLAITKITGQTSSSGSSLATSHCLFHETITPRSSRATGRGPGLTVHESQVTNQGSHF